jgi:uncharacterized membrane protein HdeD (DUF308 family)
MFEHVVRNWWIVLVRGLCAIAFGVIAFAWPGLTLLVLVLMYSAHAIVDGIAAIVLGFQMRKSAEGVPWGAMICLGLVSVAAGIVAFAWPGITAFVLLVVIATWAIIRGVFEIIAAIKLRKVIDNEWCLGLAGLSSVVFGILLIAWPAAGILSLLWLIAAAAIAFGVLQIMLSLRLRGLKSRLTSPPAT